MPEKTMTVGELREWIQDHLGIYPDEAHVFLGDGQLSLNRTKTRGTTPNGHPLVQIEFNQDYEVINDFD